jgi:hypothetical protein
MGIVGLTPLLFPCFLQLQFHWLVAPLKRDNFLAVVM